MNATIHRLITISLLAAYSLGSGVRPGTTQDCGNLFDRVEFLFDEKAYDDVIVRLYECLGSLENTDERVRAQELLAEAHLYKNENGQAKARIRYILEELDSDYEPDSTRAYHGSYAALFDEAANEQKLKLVEKDEFEVLGLRFQKRWGYMAMAAVGAGVGVAILRQSDESQPLPAPPDLREMP
jgi:hypothetical protein